MSFLFALFRLFSFQFRVNGQLNSLGFNIIISVLLEISFNMNAFAHSFMKDIEKLVAKCFSNKNYFQIRLFKKLPQVLQIKHKCQCRMLKRSNIFVRTMISCE